jgi:hypothetical protein
VKHEGSRLSGGRNQVGAQNRARSRSPCAAPLDAVPLPRALTKRSLLFGEPAVALAVRARKVRPAIACAQIDIILLDALLAAASDDERGAWTDWLSPGRCRGSRTV